QKCKNPEEEKELYAACDQFLIKQGIEVLNEKNRQQPRVSKRRSVIEGDTIQVVTISADDKTRKAVYDFLRSQTTPKHPRTLIASQKNDGSFPLHELVTEHLEIPVVHINEPIKRYVHSPALRECDASVWNTAFTITYMRIVLDKYETEWQSACQPALKWVSEQIKDQELEKELFAACEQYLFELGFDLLNKSKETTKSVTKETIRSVDVPPTRYGSDGGVLSPKDAYLNSELIVVGAACTANRQLHKSYSETVKPTKEKAREEILVFAEQEVDKLFANNVTHSNKEDVLQRAKRAARFLIDQYYEEGGCS
ncbi:2359_t:CDS:1, partial [Racocetra fulgida]